MAKKRSVSAATRARLRALRQKFGLGEFKNRSAPTKIKRGGARMARKRYFARRRSGGGKGGFLMSAIKGAIGAMVARKIVGNKAGMLQDAAAGAGVTMLLKGNKLAGAVGGVAGQMLVEKMGILGGGVASTSTENVQWFG